MSGRTHPRANSKVGGDSYLSVVTRTRDGPSAFFPRQTFLRRTSLSDLEHIMAGDVPTSKRAVLLAIFIAFGECSDF